MPVEDSPALAPVHGFSSSGSMALPPGGTVFASIEPISRKAIKLEIKDT
jgi:hypothetical protein